MKANVQLTEEFIEHDLHCLELFQEGIKVSHIWPDRPAKLEISFDGKILYKTNSNYFTNTTISIGLLSCRKLLEFLGIKYSPSGGLYNRRKAHKDDIVIENFTNSSGGTLCQVTLEDIKTQFPSNYKSVIQALETVYKHSHKFVAHLTYCMNPDEDTYKQYSLACMSLRQLMHEFYYIRSGRPVPTTRLQRY